MSPKNKIPLPIDAYTREIQDSFVSHSTLLIKASPGSGKTTRLPWALSGLTQQKILVLEPRRLAAKLAAQRIANEEDFILGQEVGYHFRFDKNYGPQTKLLFYTEGTFLKRLIHDPDLRDVGAVILDEFHERHLETDVALAALRSLQKIRPELKLILMSATLDTKLLSAFSNSKVIEVEAPRFPVEIRYLPNQPSILNQTLEQKVKKALNDLNNHSGHILVFVPGMREMKRIQEFLPHAHLLHADLSQEDALKESNEQKIILATNIAESSVTIPGVTAVIDSGIQREAHYSPWHGLKIIEDQKSTQSSAIQRAGRAGRTAPGICIRLYSEHDFNERPPFTIPEIQKADLTDTYLFSLSLKNNLSWMEPPPLTRWEEAQNLSFKLGAINEEHQLTPIGQKMLDLPLGARLSRILIEGEKIPLSEKRKLLKFICEKIEQDKYGVLEKRLHFYLKEQGSSALSWEYCVLTGFIDQVAKLRPKHHDLIHYSGKTIKLHHSLKDLHDPYTLILDITQKQEAILTLPVEENWFYDINPFPLSEEVELDKLKLKRLTKLGSIVLEEENLPLVWPALPDEQKEKIILQNKKSFLDQFEKWKNSEAFERLDFWSRQCRKTDPDELINIKDYFEEFQEFQWENIEHYFQKTLEEKLDVVDLNSELPLTINLGGKRELKIHYPVGLGPYVEAPIQDFYGLKITPTVMKGKIPVTLKLLGPHKRPLQITQDILGFWQKTYPIMKKELQRDYPRHYWPDDPITARPVLLKSHLTAKS